MKPLKLALVAACTLSLGACETTGDGAFAGMLIGAGLGAAFGSQLAGDSDSALGAALGAAVGAYIGHEIGQQLSGDDRASHDRVAAHVLWNNRVGETERWRHRNGQLGGEITPLSRIYRDRSGAECRRFREVYYYANGQTRVIDGTACVLDGRWTVVASR